MWEAGRMRRAVGTVLLVFALGLFGCSIFQPKMEVDIAASETEGVTPMVVEFSPVVAGEIEACYWDFGDGETSSEVSPVHVYRAAGTYDVFLSVTLTDGSSGTVNKGGLIDVALITAKAGLTDLYWLNESNGTIHRGDRTGNEEQTIVSYVYQGRDLAVGGGYIFWVAEGRSIFRASYDGSGKKTIATRQDGLQSVTVDGGLERVYWACAPSPQFSSSEWEGSLKWADLNGFNRTTVEEYTDLTQFTWFLRADPGGGGLYRYYDDYNSLSPLSATPKAAQDGKLQYVVFTSATTISTSRVKTSMNGITFLAVDAGSDAAYYLYWVEGSSIKRCRVGGSDETAVLQGLPTPRSIAADIVEGKMYWSDAEGIHRADLDGTNDELIYPGVRADVLVIQE